jgi:hypothetical protein
MMTSHNMLLKFVCEEPEGKPYVGWLAVELLGLELVLELVNHGSPLSIGDGAPSAYLYCASEPRISHIHLV